MSRSRPYQDAECLRELYHSERLSLREIAERLGCSSETIRRWMKRHNIDRRPPGRGIVRSVEFYTHALNGDERARSRCKGDGFEVKIHRLCAVAWFGLDIHSDLHVHHRDPIPWLNTEENLEVKEPGEHLRHHAHDNSPWEYHDHESRDRDKQGRFT